MLFGAIKNIKLCKLSEKNRLDKINECRFNPNPDPIFPIIYSKISFLVPYLNGLEKEWPHFSFKWYCWWSETISLRLIIARPSFRHRKFSLNFRTLTLERQMYIRSQSFSMTVTYQVGLQKYILIALFNLHRPNHDVQYFTLVPKALPVFNMILLWTK